VVPFEQAAEILLEVGQIAIAPSTVWRLTGKWTQKMEVLHRQEVARAQALPCTMRPVGESAETHKRMGASMDGTMIHIREEGWKETKVGCVYDVETRQGTDPVTHERIEVGGAVDSSYVAHLGGPEGLGQALWAEARQRDWMMAAESQVIGDGAAWIWNLAEEHFYTSHRTVDFYHAVEHLAEVARLLYEEGTPAHARWLSRTKALLYQGDVRRVISAIELGIRRKPALAPALTREAGYFQHNESRMNYLQMRNEGWLLGSGTVESGGKQIKARLAGPGMTWSRKGAERLLLLRTQIMSHRFQRAWDSVYQAPPN
jgi:hypothetical protein